MGVDRRSQLVQCPVCCKTIALSSINQHLDSNCQQLEKTAPSWGSLGEVRRSSPSSNKSKSLKRPSPARLSPFVECPICNKSVARINIENHLDKKCLQSQPTPLLPTPEKHPSASSTSSPISNIHALQPQPSSAFDRKGKPPILLAHIWTWRYDEKGIWTLEFQSLPNQAVKGDSSAFCCEMMCDDKTAPVRVLIRFQCLGPPFDVSDPNYASNRNQAVSYRFSPSLLKSFLQKNVRLCRPWAAVRLALQLIRRCGLTECLRRFVIIMIEDAFLHPSFPWLVSLIIACSKGFFPPAHCISLFLTLVYEIAAVDTVDLIPEGDLKISMQTDLESLGCSIDQCAIIRSLLLRASLGGMSCDVIMLKNAAHLWANRFLDADFSISIHDPRFVLAPFKILMNDDLQRMYKLETTLVDVAAVEYPDDEDLPLSAVDQHCSDVTTTLLSLPEVRILLPPADKTAEELLYSVIWRCSSSLTNKRRFQELQIIEKSQVQQSIEKVYQAIQEHLYSYAIEFISQRRSILKPPS